MFHFHKWSKWEVTHETEVVRTYRHNNERIIVGYAYIQKRVCATCGFTAYDKQQVKAGA